MAEFRDILQSIKQKKYAPVYILMGAEPYYIDQITDTLEATVVAEADKEFDQSILYGSDSNAGLLMEAAGQFPMWSEKRLVMLKEAQTLTKAKTELDKLQSYVANPNPQTVVCIAFKGDTLNKTSALMKAASKNSAVVVFDSQRVKDWHLAGVIKDYAFANKIRIEERAIELLIANVGSSLSNLFSEIEKLRVALSGNDKTITVDHVGDHIGVSKEFNNFELLNALSRREYFQSLRILKHFEENPKANSPFATVSLLFDYYQKLLIASFNEDKSDQGLMEALKPKSANALKDVRRGLQHYNASQLVRAIHAFRDFDTRAKGIRSFQKEFPLLRELILTLLTL